MQNGGPAAAPLPAQGPGTHQTANIFTPEQLHVLRNQILAFRLVKVCLYLSGLLCSSPFLRYEM